MRTLRLLVMAVAIVGLCSAAMGQEFSEDFESYVAGSDLQDQGGWKGWGNDPAASAPVSDTYAYSGSNSVEVVSSADLVHEFDVEDGKWVLSAMVYIPSGTSGTSDFIVLNTYDDAGNNRDWSEQILFALSDGTLSCYYVDGSSTEIVYDEWVELKLVIDLDENTVDDYYNGTLFATHDWDDDADSDVVNTIGCLDLFGNGASSIYYDDIVLETYVARVSRAGGPDPAPGSEGAANNVVLSWTPGEETVSRDVYFGTVYTNVSSASRTEPLDVLASEGQSATTFTSEDLLEYGTTYYWRIDEIGSDGTIYQGPVWSFTVEPYLHAIEDITATSNTTPVEDGAPENTVNGSGLGENDQHSIGESSMWLGEATEGETPYIQFEFDRTYKLCDMLIWNYNSEFEYMLGFGISEATVEYSTDGTEWTTLADVSLNQGTGSADYTANTTVEFAGVTAKFVRLTTNSTYGPYPRCGLSEVRFIYLPAAAYDPKPADGTVDVDVDADLTWRSGREAVSHEVYLGTDPNALALTATTTGPACSPALDLETTYYWQVVEVNDAETPSAWSSDVWTFTTADHIMVEDFESYDDEIEAGTTVWQTWIDGLVESGGDTENGGGIVGNADAPFAEVTFVQTGNQAMPFAYENSSNDYSQTTCTFDTAQDWSQHGITTLTVWFRGQRDNATSDQLYVKINGTKAVYEGDLTSPIYLPFNVDLTSLGISLSSVKTLSVGVDGSSDGQLLIDDISLYRVAPVDPAAEGDKTLVGHWTLDETEGLVAADSSAYGNDGRLIGMDGSEWTDGMADGALTFAGTASNPQYVNLGNSSSLQFNGSVTISAWVKMEESTSGVYMGIAGKLEPTYAGFALVRHTSNVFRFWADDGAGVISGHDASSDEEYTDTDWHHVVGVVDGGTSTLYVDGVKQSIQGSGIDLTDSGQYAYIGKQYGVSTSDRYWKGLIDDVRIYYRALSADEIAGL